MKTGIPCERASPAMQPLQRFILFLICDVWLVLLLCDVPALFRFPFFDPWSNLVLGQDIDTQHAVN